MEAWVFVLFIALGALFFAWSWRRARRLCERWALAHDLELENARFCWFWRGPMRWHSSDAQAVFRIAVRDAQGRRRTGWLRCGGFCTGLFSTQTAVIWDAD